jgi:hypothetical protein
MAKAAKKKKAKVAQRGPWVGVALYNLGEDTENGRALREILGALGLPAREIPPERLGCQVGAIAGLPGFKLSKIPHTAPAPTCEFMLMCNLPRETFDALLAAMKDANLDIGHKAMLTKYNQLWPVHTLISEVTKEHAALSGDEGAQSASVLNASQV